MAFQVLLVDDHKIMRDGIKAILRHSEEFAVFGEAESGTEAVQMCRKEKPDIILMDLAMPVLDGLSAARVLRSAAPTARIPVVAFTGCVWDTQGVFDAGCAAFLTKPCSPEKLLMTMAQVLERRGWRKSARPLFAALIADKARTEFR